MIKVLVTGANGFLGQTLIRQLLDKNYEVVGLIFGSKNQKLLIKHKNLSYIILDICKNEEFKKLAKTKNIKAIFHTAAYIDFGEELVAFDKCFEANVRGTLNLLEYCRVKKIKKFIYSSTVSIYNSKNKSPIKESDSVLPNSFYGLSKLMGEHLCLYYQKKHGIKSVILRYGGLYGLRGQPINTVNIFISQAINKKNFLIYGRGKEMRDWTYVEDAAAANIKSFKSNKNGIFNIAGGKGVRIKEVVIAVKKIFASQSEIVYVKKNSGQPQMVYDINKAKKELKFFPTSLFKALEEIKSEYEANIF